MTLSHRGRRNREAGASFERAVANYLRDAGFDGCRRNLDRRVDEGDLLATGPVAIETKHVARLDLSGWLAQAKAGAERAGKPLAVVVHKRRGVGDVGQSYVTLDLQSFVALLGDAMEPGVVRDTGEDNG